MYKPAYTQDEMKELFEWFEQHKEQLPNDLHYDNATYIPDLRRSVDSMVRCLKGKGINTSLAGQANILFTIRDLVAAALGL